MVMVVSYDLLEYVIYVYVVLKMIVILFFIRFTLKKIKKHVIK